MAARLLLHGSIAALIAAALLIPVTGRTVSAQAVTSSGNPCQLPEREKQLVKSDRAARLIDPSGTIDSQRQQLMLQVLTTGVVASPFASPITVALGLALIDNWNGALWSDYLMADDALMTGWTMQNLLDLSYSVRGSMLAGRDLITKLEQDHALLRQRARDGFAAAGRQQAGAANAVALDDVRIEYLGERLRYWKPALEGCGKHVTTLLDGVRDRVIAGRFYQRGQTRQVTEGGALTAMYFTPEMIGHKWELARALVSYAEMANALERDMTAPVRTNTTIDGRLSAVEVQPTAMQQLRMMLSNESDSLVFFVRIHTSRPDGTRVIRGLSEVTEEDLRTARSPRLLPTRWLVLYPRGAAVEQGAPPPPGSDGPAGAGVAAGRATDVVSLQLPSNVWMPVKPGDRLELRVATYGERRKRIRWMPLFGTRMRPDPQSVRRGFYYLGYKVPFEADGLLSRHYPTREQYSWQFTGATGVEQNLPTPVDELRDATTGTMSLSITGDHVRWTLPASLAAIDQSPIVRATVNGVADIVHALGSRPIGRFQEKGGGDLSISLQVW